MSAYETAEIRNLFNRGSLNMAGRIKTELFYDGVLGSVKPGVRQTFVRFDASDIQTEDDARFTYFTTKVSQMSRGVQMTMKKGSLRKV